MKCGFTSSSQVSLFIDVLETHILTKRFKGKQNVNKNCNLQNRKDDVVCLNRLYLRSNKPGF